MSVSSGRRALNPRPSRRAGLRGGAILLPVALLVAQTLFQLMPAVAAATVPVGPSSGPVTMTVNNGITGGTYAGFNADATNPNAQNLTAAGATDWRVWGESSTALTGDERKTGGSGISGLTDINPTPTLSLRALGPLALSVGTGGSSVPFSFSWTDGTSSSTAGPIRSGLQHNNNIDTKVTGHGFSFSVTSAATTQRLRVWVSAHHGAGLLTATLGSTTVTDGSINGGQNHGGVYTIDFTGDGSPGQTLAVSYVLSSAVATSVVDSDGYPSSDSNVVVYAAALSPVAPSADFGIGAAPTSLTIPQGHSDQAAISTTQVGSAGTVALSAAVTPASAGVTASLSAASVAAGSPATLAISASASATSGAYTVTVTGLEGSNTHQVTVSVAVIPSTGAPILFRAVPQGSTGVFLAGLLHASPSSSYSVRLVTSSTCTNGVLGEATNLATVSVSTDSRGDSYFGGSIATTAAVSTFIAAQVVPPDAYSPVGPCIVASPDNDSWIRALPLTGANPLNSTGYIDAAGRGRWYKFTIQPGSRINVTLSNLPADYDLFLFKDISQAYTTLTSTANLTKLSAEFAPSAFSPSAFSPSAFSPSAFSPSAFSPSAFSPSAFSPSVYSPSAFSPSAFSPSAFSPSAFSPSAFSPSAFSPSAFSPSAFSPSAFSPSAFSADAFSSAQTRSLIGISAGVGTGNETLVGDTWTNTGSYYILVGGKNGASSLAQPFALSVTVTGNTCAGVGPLGTPPPAASAQSLTSLIIEDTSRQPGGSTDVAALQTRLATFAGRPEVGGTVVDLAGSAYSQIQQLNAQADTHRDCVYAKNLVASAIKDLVTSYRTTNPGLKYVVLIGGDKVIPFFRYPDQSLLGPESDYVPPVDPASASEASLRSNYVLGQDEYGASTVISLGAISFPVPDLAVGRLVETAAEASGLIDAYLATTGGVTATPSTSLVTGYDFLADAATSVQGDLNAGTGRTGDALISLNNIAPTAGWTATQLKTALFGSRHDLIFLAGHFSANNALAADFSTTVNSTDLAASTVDMTNSIVFSAGCHSGYNIVDSDALSGVTQPLDWVQAFARKKATLIAGTGYQYGDTDFLEYSERIYAEFAHQLRIGPNADGSGAVSVGQAFVRAKQVYLARTPDIRGLHQKALLESTLFGLPMLSVNMPSGRIPAPSTSSIVGATTGFAADPGLTLGLQSTDATINPSTTAHTVGLSTLDASGAATGSVTATYYSGRDGVVTNPGEPALPLQSEDVTVTGKVLRGVGFRGGTFTDSSVVPLTGAPNTEIRGVHTAFSSTAFFPMRPWTINYYDALDSSGGATRLLVTPGQHKVAQIGDTNATLRLYSQLGLRLFYSSYTGASAQSAAPTITAVAGVLIGSVDTFGAHVVGNPAAGIQQVWITWTGKGAGAGAGTWQSVDLAQDGTDSTLWAGTLTLPSGTAASDVRFMVQAANGLGLVSLDDNLGADYAVASASTAAPATTTTILDATPSTGVYGSTATVGATLTSAGNPLPGATVVFTIGTTTLSAVTGSTGHASASLPLTSAPGVYSLSAGYAGDAGHTPSGDARSFTITKLGTTLTLSVASSWVTLGADSGVQATLADANGAPLSFRTIFFLVSGAASRTTTASTDFAGRAFLGVLPSAVGAYSVTACFNGPTPAACATLNIPDSTYVPSGGTTTVSQWWPFNGFFSPVDNAPYFNSANAGQTIPVKFSLGGDRGLTIFKTGYPKVVTIPCSSTAPVSAIDELSTATTSGLQYDPTTFQYTYVWKTAKSMAGYCWQLQLGLVDGSVRIANFTFK
ncbi:MAG: hypothetical protein NVS9B8_08220 [Candidatus Limnocylindrales bacterium]